MVEEMVLPGGVQQRPAVFRPREGRKCRLGLGPPQQQPVGLSDGTFEAAAGGVHALEGPGIPVGEP